MLLNTIQLLLLALCFSSCGNKSSFEDQKKSSETNISSTTNITNFTKDSVEKVAVLSPKSLIDTKNTTPEELVSFAKTLVGIPYLYGSVNPNKGFDCSGFITYVFNHFQIAVPRSSRDFANVGITIPVSECKPGDLILFTGTDSTKREIGHMGIITDHVNNVQFIHSTSGKAYSVTITPLNKYYLGRFVKIIRPFN
ncbi:C40 family peptidase [Pedobacter cryophilus]|uniref:NlpC/P60 family protein n=1 Tax=Pedobacter cryophilus TaxID=2571271 RepID=A0A4V6WMU8_9SPHI|nr:C40 family peptidase [Pedobacter cryophilus]TKB95564.1 NlpC/P60 family protein [Pedobacter cryophilus]